MLAPYRGSTPSNDREAEARELAAFARQMHAERRFWTNRHVGDAIILLLMASALLVLGCAVRSLAMLPMAFPWLALGIHELRAISRNSSARRPNSPSP
jgi:hypothetical protein